MNFPSRRRAHFEIQDVLKEVKPFILQGNLLISESKQLIVFRKSLKPIRFTRSLPPQAYLSLNDV